MNTFILDTSTLLADPKIYATLSLLPDIRGGTGQSDAAPRETKIVIPKTVLGELDSLKSAEGNKGFQARQASRILEQVIRGCLRIENGWRISDDCILILDEQPVARSARQTLPRTGDDQILAYTQTCMEQYSVTHDTRAVWLAARDRNMRIRADSRGIRSMDPAAVGLLAICLQASLSWCNRRPLVFARGLNNGVRSQLRRD
jgi:predicted ribonuclease YlaK